MGFLGKFVNKLKNTEKPISETEETEELVVEESEEIDEESREVSNEEKREIIDKNNDIISYVMDIDLHYLNRLEEQLGENDELRRKLKESICILAEVFSGDIPEPGDLLLVKNNLIEVLEEIQSDDELNTELKKKLIRSPIQALKRFIYHDLNEVENLVTIIDSKVIEKGAKFLNINEKEFEKLMDGDPAIVIRRMLEKIGRSNAKFEELIEGHKKISKAKLVLIIAAVMALSGGVSEASAQSLDGAKKNISYIKETNNIEVFIKEKVSKEIIVAMKGRINELKKQKNTKFEKVSNEDIESLIENLGWIRRMQSLSLEDATKIAKDLNIDASVENDGQDNFIQICKDGFMDQLDNYQKMAYINFQILINEYTLKLKNPDQGQANGINLVLDQLLKDKEQLAHEINKDLLNQGTKEIVDNVYHLRKLIMGKVDSHSNKFDEELIFKKMAFGGTSQERSEIKGLVDLLRTNIKELVEKKTYTEKKLASAKTIDDIKRYGDELKTIEKTLEDVKLRKI